MADFFNSTDSKRANARSVNVDQWPFGTSWRASLDDVDVRGFAMTRSVSPGLVRLALLAVVAVVAMVLMTTGLGDESSIGLHDDTPHYLMNGVFMNDVVRDLPVREPLRYAQRYFARYPGLTLGHHPLLPPMIGAPLAALFGPSIWAGRIGVIGTLLLMLFFWFRLIERAYGTWPAFAASVSLASATSVIMMSQTVESEPLALCLSIVSLYLLQSYCESERPRDFALFVVAVVASMYAKQLTVMLLPVYALLYVMRFGVRRVFSGQAIVATLVVGACAVPLLLLTLHYSHFNVQIVTTFVGTANRVAGSTFLQLGRSLTLLQVTWPVLALAVAGAVVALGHRDRYAVLFLGWVVSVAAGLALLGVRDSRYACYVAPAWCGLTASLVHVAGSWGRPRLRQAVAVLLLGAGLFQVTASASIHPRGGGGYEEAAEFVTGQRLGDAVLYCASEDGGYFVFFVRKHDPRREMIVLRADKVLTTSRMFRSDFERVIQSPSEIEPILKRFGVGYVVLEDHPYPDGPLAWLREAVQGDQFTLRRRIPIVTSETRLAGASLAVYEYKARTPADPNAPLSMKIPLMDDSISVTFRDLLHDAAQR